MNYETKGNPYITEAINQFKEYYNRKTELESKFSPDIVQEYTEVVSNYNNSAVELLKLGVDKRLEETMIVLIIDDNEYSVSRKDVLKAIGEKQWNVLFPIEELDKTPGSLDDNDYKEVEDLREAHYSDSGNGYQPPINMINPLGAFISSLCTSFLGNMAGYGMNHGYTPYPNVQMPSQAPQPKKEEISDSSRSTDIMNDFAGIQKKLILLEKERDTAQESLAAVKQKYERQKKESAEKVEHVTAELKQAQEKFDEANKKLIELAGIHEKLQKDADDNKKNYEIKISSLIQENESRKQSIMNFKKTNDEISAKLKITEETLDKTKRDADIKINELISKIHTLESSLSESSMKAADTLRESVEKAKNEAAQKSQNALKDIQSKLNEQISKAAEYKTNAEHASKQRDELQKKISALTDENNKLKRDIEKSNKSIAAYKEQSEAFKKQDTEKELYYKRLQDEAQQLKVLAYTDPKTGVMNTNAFNRDFPTCNKSETVLAMIGIRNMKGINMMHGRGSGDAVISMVTEQLSKTFGKNNVYLILGDQYAIITRRTVRDTIYMQIDAIKRTLNSQNIDIAFGVAAGTESSDLNSLIGVAEERMNHMKAGSSIMSAQSAMGNNSSNNTRMNQTPENPGYDNINNGYQMPGNNTAPKSLSSMPEEVDIDGLIEDYIKAEN